MLANLDGSYERYIDPLRKAMGILQHHDAVTGTAKEHVVHDYTQMWSSGIDDAEVVTSASLR